MHIKHAVEDALGYVMNGNAENTMLAQHLQRIAHLIPDPSITHEIIELAKGLIAARGNLPQSARYLEAVLQTIRKHQVDFHVDIQEPERKR